MYDVISFGAATVDIFAKSDNLIVNKDLLSIPYSSKNEITQGLICSGGGATNTSVSFSRLGLKSACVSLIGNDPLTEYITSELENDNVDVSLLSQNKNDTTDFSIILVAPDGGRSILTSRGDSKLEEDNIAWDKIQHSKWFYITSLEGNVDLLEKLIGFAKEFDIKIALNPGNRELKQPKQLTPLLKHIDFLLLNQTESETLTGLDSTDPRFWEKLHHYGNKITAITNGREGAHILTSDKDFYSPIINVKPVDETGAGDGFGSAFIAALIHNITPANALFWGIKNSASVVAFLGAKEGLLKFEEISK